MGDSGSFSFSENRLWSIGFCFEYGLVSYRFSGERKLTNSQALLHCFKTTLIALLVASKIILVPFGDFLIKSCHRSTMNWKSHLQCKLNLEDPFP